MGNRHIWRGERAATYISKSFIFNTFIEKPEINNWFYIWLPNKYLGKPCLISRLPLSEVLCMPYQNVALDGLKVHILNQCFSLNETLEDST